ncbi:hypothetical protein INR49_000288 [Caranx melampygus]|nr:hypothetical protein INR49_000288 [Caranx melampygus]
MPEGMKLAEDKEQPGRSVLAKFSVLNPCRELKPTLTPPSASRDSQSRWSPLRDNLCRLDVQYRLEARPETMLATVRPPGTQEASSSCRRCHLLQQLVSHLLWEQWGPAEAHGAVCSPAAQGVQAAAHLSQAEVVQALGASSILPHITSRYHRSPSQLSQDDRLLLVSPRDVTGAGTKRKIAPSASLFLGMDHPPLFSPGGRRLLMQAFILNESKDRGRHESERRRMESMNLHRNHN